MQNINTPMVSKKKIDTNNLPFYNVIQSMENPRVIESVRDCLSPAQKFDNLFNEEECDWLYKFAFSGKLKVRRNTNGTLFAYGLHIRECYEKFQERIDQILPGASSSVSVEGNFFITPSQYGIHNDSPQRKDYLHSLNSVPADHPQRRFAPWKNLIIPLWQAQSYAKSQIVFFEQRHIDWAHAYNHGNAMPIIATQYPIANDHGLLQFYDRQGIAIPRENNYNSYDKEHYEKYLSYTPYNRLTGLSPETTFDWVPGTPMSFDAVQLHATNRGSPEWRLKMGLLLTFVREVQ